MDNIAATIQKLEALFQEIALYRHGQSRKPHEPQHDIFEIVTQAQTPEIEQFLIKAILTNSHLWARTTAIEALGRIKAESATEILLTILKKADEDREVRSEAALSLGRIGDMVAVPTLIETLKNRRNGRMVMWHCADALGIGRFNFPEVIDALIDALVSDYSRIKDSSDITDAARDALVSIGGEYTVKKLIEKLAMKMLNPVNYMDDDIYADIIIALGRIQNPLAVNPLLEIVMHSPRTYLQESAIDSLASFDDPRIILAIQAASSSPDEDVRNSAKRALDKIKLRND